MTVWYYFGTLCIRIVLFVLFSLNLTSAM
uniref:Uncharacterized protein n=1 Tax=Anguilla anguilla TaxID=7936 RepID=A0A0E9V6B1_ANGAN